MEIYADETWCLSRHCAPAQTFLSSCLLLSLSLGGSYLSPAGWLVDSGYYRAN